MPPFPGGRKELPQIPAMDAGGVSMPPFSDASGGAMPGVDVTLDDSGMAHLPLLDGIPDLRDSSHEHDVPMPAQNDTGFDAPSVGEWMGADVHTMAEACLEKCLGHMDAEHGACEKAVEQLCGACSHVDRACWSRCELDNARALAPACAGKGEGDRAVG